MNTQKPAGDIRPPCEAAPQNVETAFAPPVPLAGTVPSPEPLAGLMPPLAGPPAGPGAAFPYAIPAERLRQPFSAARADGLFVPLCLVLGFFWVRWILWSGTNGWGVALFCAMYGALVLGYARAKEVRPSPASWYWLAILLLCGSSYALWPVGVLALPKALLLYGTAVLWVGSLFGIQLQGKTGNWLPLDAVNLLFLVPARNFGTGAKSLAALLPKRGAERAVRPAGRRLLPAVLAGLALCVPLLAVIAPQLAAADTGNFGRIISEFFRILREIELWRNIREEIAVILPQVLMGLPVGWWLFSYFAGSAHKRYVRNIDLKAAQRNLAAARRVPGVTVMIVLSAACALYLLFIGCQLPYFFAAFSGGRPDGYLAYSEYARAGFFELCRIAAINLGLMALAGGFAARREDKAARAPAGGAENGTPSPAGAAGLFGPAPGLRVLILLLCALTLLIIATALSKMGLYIAVYGFTPKRVLTSVFMVFLALVCVAAAVLQYRRFSIVRVAAAAGAAMLCGLCLCNLDGMVARANAARWENGSLAAFDEQLALRGGAAGAGAAMEVYESLDAAEDREAKLRLEWALYRLRWQARVAEGSSRDNLANAQARAAIVIPRIDTGEGLSADRLEWWRNLSDAERDNWEWRQMEEAQRLFDDYYNGRGNGDAYGGNSR